MWALVMIELGRIWTCDGSGCERVLNSEYQLGKFPTEQSCYRELGKMSNPKYKYMCIKNYKDNK